jgi:hypothetical protein
MGQDHRRRAGRGHAPLRGRAGRPVRGHQPPGQPGERHAHRAVVRVRTGTIGVNYYNLDLGAPFGGMKDSGIGRELGPEALNNYLEYKSIYASANQL